MSKRAAERAIEDLIERGQLMPLFDLADGYTDAEIRQFMEETIGICERAKAALRTTHMKRRYTPEQMHTLRHSIADSLDAAGDAIKELQR